MIQKFIQMLSKCQGERYGFLLQNLIFALCYSLLLILYIAIVI